MSHFKKIRRSLKGLEIHPKTRSWLHQKRLEEMDLENRLAGQIKRAEAAGKCTAFIMSKPGSQTMYKSEPPTPGRLCGQPAFRRGYCTDHFITHFLHLRERRGGRAGRGVSVRPFAAYQFPSGRLSPLQEDLMADLERLPLSTVLDVCISRLNEEDPSNILAPISRRSLKKRPSGHTPG
jgi:hypothetical protein